MLPPDTFSTLLPWRVMVPMMQVYGCFPYRVSATSGPPTFSLALCLWSVFQQLLLVNINWMTFSKNFLPHLSSDLGTAAYISTTAMTMIGFSSAPTIMGIESGMLAALLIDMSDTKGISLPPTYRWYCRPKTIALLLSIISTAIYFVWAMCDVMDSINFFGIVLYSHGCVIWCIGYLLPEEVSSMVFGLLARRLVAATETTMATVSSLLAPSGSFKCESDVEAAMLVLRNLDAVIQEVEEQRKRGIRYFFPVVTLFLLMAVLTTISCPYAVMKGIYMDGTTIFSVVVAFYIMGRFFHLGHDFGGQVSTAQTLLKNLRVKSKNLSFNVKVSQVMGSLSPMLTFDMCGWYRLDYASFLGLMNTVLTYLVIIFQVGGNTVNNAHSSSSPNNSTAPA